MGTCATCGAWWAQPWSRWHCESCCREFADEASRIAHYEPDSGECRNPAALAGQFYAHQDQHGAVWHHGARPVSVDVLRSRVPPRRRHAR